MQIFNSSTQKLLEPFILTDKQLLDISNNFRTQLLNGLTSPESCNSLRLFPTFIDDLPTGQEYGDYLALDLGGTNFRVLLIHLAGNSCNLVKNRKFSVSQKLMTGTGEALFDYIAKCIYEFVCECNLLGKYLRLGFTFSFPCHQTSKSTAILSQWTKGFNASDVVGHDVGKLLSRSLAHYSEINIEIVAIVNDTAGTLVSCAYQDTDCRVGFIVGTGVNACYLEERHLNCRMVINTELGAFGSKNGALETAITEHDCLVDKFSRNQGKHIFEKMISGMYLGEIVRRILLSYIDIHSDRFSIEFVKKISIFDSFPTSFLSEIELDCQDSLLMPNTVHVLRQLDIENPTLEQCQIVHHICSTVSTRSAHLVASVLSSLLRHLHRPSTVIGFDGSVYRCHPHFRSKVEKKTRQLLNAMNCEDCSFRFMLSEDGSGCGAALIAALPVKNNVQTSSLVCSQCRAQVPYSRQKNDCPQCLSVAISV